MFNKERLREIAKNSDWIERARWRRDNEYWLNISAKISLEILIALRNNNIEKEYFLNQLTFTGDDILKGQRNFTLSELIEIENILDINLVNKFDEKYET